MTLRLLDTNTLSALVRDPFGAVALKMNATANENLCTSIIVACELRFGADKRSSDSLRRWIETILDEINVEPLSESVDRHYAHLRSELERKGTPIGNNDMLIAAHALALDAILVTANTREFARVESLQLEHWII